MTTERGDHQGDDRSPASAYDGLLPAELIESHQRREASRSRVRRAHERSVLRRRVVPTVAVASVTLVGAGLANSFVGSTVPVATTTTTEAVSAQRQNVADARTLAKLDRTIAEDRRIVAALDSTAQVTTVEAASVASPSSNGPSTATGAGARRATSTAGTTTNSTSPTTTSKTPSTSSTSSSSPSSSSSTPTTTPVTTPVTSTPTTTPAPPVTVTTVAVAPTTVPVTTTTAPPTHTTTGASGAG